MVGILGGKFRHADAESAARFHAAEDEIDSVGVGFLQAAQGWQDVILFADSFIGPWDGDLVIGGVSLDPRLIIMGALAEDFFVNHRKTENLAEQVNHLLGPG